MYISPSNHDAARMWTPCIDSLWERCTWELIFIAPAHIDDLPVTVVSSGELIEQTTHPHASSKVIFSYLQANPTSVQHVAFAAGPFEMHSIAESPRPIIGFCLPGDLGMMIDSTITLQRAMEYVTTEYGSYPFTDFKAVFVADPRANVTSATLAILSSDLLSPPSVIDQVIESRQIISHALITQWIGINVIQRSLSDTWVTNGLALYLSSLFLRHELGNNEYRFRLKKDIDRCVRLDQGDQWPICVPGSTTLDSDFVNLKAPLVMHVLDRHIAKAGTSLGLSRVIPRILLSALSDELPGNTLSTPSFFRTCRKTSGLDLQAFQDQWVYGSGCPHLRLTATFVRKKFQVEFTALQTHPGGKKRPSRFFEGSLTVRIHEADGAPFEHLLDIKQPHKTFTLPFNTKYKRTRRSGHIAAKFQVHDDDPEENQLQDSERAGVFTYPPWEDELERQEWRVAEWDSDQAATMLGEGGGYEWIRVDPECEWLASFEFTEKPWYWISQLQGDRDVVAQLEAIQNMAKHPLPIIASELAKTVLVANYFYRVRMEAARALVMYCSSQCDYIGLFLLVKLYRTLFFNDRGPRPNDFSDFATYFLQKSIISALADLRDPVSQDSWRDVRILLLETLRGNDNSQNTYSDAFYVAVLVTALGKTLIATTDETWSRDVDAAVERAITMDRLVPSYHNVISEACLKYHLKSILSGKSTNDPRLFLSYTREGNYEPLRLVAFDALLLCRPPGRSLAMTTYLFDVILDDSSLTVRRHVARALSESILMSLAVGDIATPVTTIIEATEQSREPQIEAQNNLIVKSLRKEYSKKLELRQMIQNMIMKSATMDDGIRLAFLKIAEITTHSVPEPLPGNILTLPTPTEAPVSTPRIRISVGSEEGYGFPQMERLEIPAKAVVKKKVQKSQTKGLPDADLIAIRNALRKMVSHKCTLIFRQPVDPIRDGAPNYLSIIKNPMDLSTAEAKLANGMYGSRSEFVEDIRTIISNCYTYNSIGDPVRTAGENFEQFFNNLWSTTESTLNISRVKPEPAVEPKPLVKVKMKPPKSVTIEPPMPPVPPMAPPPIPRKAAVDPSRKRKGTNNVDDLLGKEVDAMERQQPDLIEALLEPKAKKAKLPGKPTPPAMSERLPIMPRQENRDRLVTPAATSDADQKNGFASRDATPFRAKRASMLMATLMKHPQAGVFAHPVDPVAEGVPTYFEEIKEPMDFGTINQSIEMRKYKTMGQFAYDIELVFKNCRSFNHPGDYLVGIANEIDSIYRKEWPKIASIKMTPDERKAMSALLSRASKDERGYIFRDPVDPVALNIPNYFEVIPREEARDLSMIKNNLEKNRYMSARHVDEDIELMLENCQVYNREGEVVDIAITFGKWWQAQRAKMD